MTDRIEELIRERDNWRELQHSAAQCLANRIKESEARGREIDRLRGTLSLAEEGLANYEEEMQARITLMQAKDAEIERLKADLHALRNQSLTWAMTCHHECPECDRLYDVIRGDVPQTPEHK
jgi:DNA repair exonuclease SbcCD ATPase subunit